MTVTSVNTMGLCASDAVGQLHSKTRLIQNFECVIDVAPKLFNVFQMRASPPQALCRDRSKKGELITYDNAGHAS